MIVLSLQHPEVVTHKPGSGVLGVPFHAPAASEAPEAPEANRRNST